MLRCVMIQTFTKCNFNTSAEKKILTFVSIQSGDISVYQSCHVLLQPSAVTSSSDKRRSNRDALSRIAELSRLPRKRHHLIEILRISLFLITTYLTLFCNCRNKKSESSLEKKVLSLHSLHSLQGLNGLQSAV